MLKSKLGKKLAASATALAMIATATASSISSLTAFAGAGVMTGEGTFEDGAGLPWHTCENATGAMAFAIDNGVYNILIKNPGGAAEGGEDRWDCQFRHRGLSITYGHTYRITYSIYATNPGKVYAKLGDINNNDAEYWHQCGNELDLTYKAGMSMDDLEAALRGAKSKSGKTVDLNSDLQSNSSNWDVPYWQGWNSWKDVTIPAKTWTTFSYEFIIDKAFMENVKGKEPEGKGTVEWTYHIGGTGTDNSDPMFPAGTIVKFDNLMLIDMSGDNGYVPDAEKPMFGVAVNQLGYYTNLKKQATVVVEQGAAPVKFDVIDAATGKVVYSEGTASETDYDKGAWEYCQVLDFSDFKTPGTYKIKVNGKESSPFRIGNDIYGNLLPDALNYYYLNRSGIAIEEKYIQNAGANESKSALTRKAGHSPDVAIVVDEWNPLYTQQTNDAFLADYGSKEKIDVSGGWYDAGDYGKYVVNGGVSMWTLANIYERSVQLEGKDASKWADGSSIMNIPETGDPNKTPDILDELKWEAEFFLKMQRSDGFVYHKMHDYRWTGLGVMPYDDTIGDDSEAAVKARNSNFPQRIVKPHTYAATLNAAATLAQLSRLLKPYDSAKAAEYLAAAEKAYDAAKTKYVAAYGATNKPADDAAKNPLFAPLDQNKGGGPYGDTQVTDEFYWAACELYVTTDDKTYYEDLKTYDQGGQDKAFSVTCDLVGGENAGSPTSFTWGTLAALGTATLALHKDKISSDEYKMIEHAFQEAGDTYLGFEEESMYGTPYPGHTYDTKVTYIHGDTDTVDEDVPKTLEGGYEWGSNSMVINNAVILGMAYDITHQERFLNGVTTAMDYILGRNGMENSYVTGYGDTANNKVTQNPHHRYWCHEMKSDWPYAPNGCLSGGPNSDMNDPLIQGAGYAIGDLAPMKCYLDKNDAWSVNEITINWNAPLVWIASFVEDEAPKAGEGTTDPKPSESNTPDGQTKYGDVDVDGDVDLIDVITLNKYLMIAEPLSEQGMINADVNIDTFVTPGDALNILRSVVKLIDLPVTNNN